MQEVGEGMLVDKDIAEANSLAGRRRTELRSRAIAIRAQRPGPGGEPRSAEGPGREGGRVMRKLRKQAGRWSDVDLAALAAGYRRRRHSRTHEDPRGVGRGRRSVPVEADLPRHLLGAPLGRLVEAAAPRPLACRLQPLRAEALEPRGGRAQLRLRLLVQAQRVGQGHAAVLAHLLADNRHRRPRQGRRAPALRLRSRRPVVLRLHHVVLEALRDTGGGGISVLSGPGSSNFLAQLSRVTLRQTHRRNHNAVFMRFLGHDYSRVMHKRV
jgi:hypothetical protein